MRFRGGTFMEIRLIHNASLLQDGDLGKCVISVLCGSKFIVGE
jgi:hypothetical protein